MKVSDSVWHRQLSDLGRKTTDGTTPYWLIPFQNAKTNCPYLVGTYSRVAAELAHYIAVGYRTFILDVPPSQDELSHIKLVFASAMVGRRDGQVA
jgi:alkanesulfonate monooxygenase